MNNADTLPHTRGKKIIEQIAVRDEERKRQQALLEEERIALLKNIEIMKQND